MIRVLVCGIAGRMGQALRALVEAADDLELAGGIDREPLTGSAAAALGCSTVAPPAGAAPLLDASDVVVDFSSPAALRTLLQAGGDRWRGRGLVVGTTGLGAEETALLDAVARDAAVVQAANYSVGVNLLLQLVATAARVLPGSAFDLEIVEAHHGAKVDAPSGTALALAEAAARARDVDLAGVRRDGRSGEVGARPAGEIGLHALRGGSVVGEHRVHFLGHAERLELSHIATDRRLFAEGALLAARWARGRPAGRYQMKDVLGF